MRIFLGQVNPVIGDYAANVRAIVAATRRAREAGAAVALFPELAVSGYPPLDLLEKSAFVRDGLAALDEIAAEARGIEIVAGFAEPNRTGAGNALFNSAAVCRDGRVAQVVRKTLLPTYDVFDEDRHFEPAVERATVTLGGIPAGLSICEDAWSDPSLYHRRLYGLSPMDELAAAGARFLVNISASPFSLGRAAVREGIMRDHAVRLGLPVICVNQVGGNDSLLFDGSSVALDRAGTARLRLAAFREDEAVVDLDALLAPASGAGAAGVARAAGIDEEALGALVMGTRDYVRKCGFERAVIGLSGGIDSSVVAAIAVESLGREAVSGVAMPSRFSSPESLEDARALAENLGIEFRVIPIDGLFQKYLDELTPEFGGLPADTTEENLQARIRGNVLMALSNKFGRLVLTTGNKSEISVGYCTLYGDMSGGLAVLSDVPKTLVYAIGRRINRARPVIPERVFSKPPSAELRAGQTDQDSLPPYDVLDRILALYVEERVPAERIIEAGFDRALVRDVLRRVDGAEYKREQAATGLRITSKAFGPGRRMPVAQRYREI